MSVFLYLTITGQLSPLIITSYFLSFKIYHLSLYKLIDFIFCNLSSPGGKAFLELLLPRLNPRNINGGPAMPFQLEVMDLYSNPCSR